MYFTCTALTAHLGSSTGLEDGAEPLSSSCRSRTCPRSYDGARHRTENTQTTATTQKPKQRYDWRPSVQDRLFLHLTPVRTTQRSVHADRQSPPSPNPQGIRKQQEPGRTPRTHGERALPYVCSSCVLISKWPQGPLLASPCPLLLTVRKHRLSNP